MLSSVTSKLKTFIGVGTREPARKRTLNSDEQIELFEVGVEPARKRTRSLDDQLVRAYAPHNWRITNVPKYFTSKASVVLNWMTSYAKPPPREDPVEKNMLPVVKARLQEERWANGQGAAPHLVEKRNRSQDEIFAFSPQDDEDEVQYIGTSPRAAVPTRRPTMPRHTPATSTTRHIPSTSRHTSATSRHTLDSPSAFGSFRFSPTVVSTASKAPAGSTSSNRFRDTTKGVVGSKSSKLTSINRRSLGISRPSTFSDKKKKFFNITSRSKSSFQYDEKMRYQQLLAQFADSPIMPSSYTGYRGISNSSSNATSVYERSACSSRCGSPQGLVKTTRLDSEWTKMKRQEIESGPPQPLTSPVYKVISKASAAKSSGSIPVIDLSACDSEASNHSKGSVSNPASVTESDGDSITITREVRKAAPPATNSLEERFKASPIYHAGFIKSIREKYEKKGKSREEEAQQAAKARAVFEERRKAMTSLDERVAQSLKNLDLTYPSKVQEIQDEEEEKVEDLPPITDHMNDVISAALRKSPPGEVLVEKFSIQVTRRDIHTLNGLNWLNDEVINFYMSLLVERGKNDNYPSVYAFNTFFYPKLLTNGYSSIRRWTKKVDVFSQDLVLVPVHLGMHWCLATIDLRDKHIRYYDSMLGDNNTCLEALRKYLCSEHEDKKKSPYNTSDWTLVNVKDIPQQMNGSDCGMFACKFAEYLSRNAAITFDQQNMVYFRLRMIFEIVSAKLL